jgi:hypothetical protein
MNPDYDAYCEDKLAMDEEPLSYEQWLELEPPDPPGWEGGFASNH